MTKWLGGVERGALNPGSGGGGATISLNPPLTGGERGVERGVEPE